MDYDKIAIAPNLITKDISYRLQHANFNVNLSTYEFSKYTEDITPETISLENTVDQMYYNLYPENIKPFVKATNSGKNLYDSMIAELGNDSQYNEHMGNKEFSAAEKYRRYMRTESKQSSDKLMMTALDLETFNIGMQNDVMQHGMIFEYNFIHSSANGKGFKIINPNDALKWTDGKLLQSGEKAYGGLIGISDNKVMSYMDEIASKLKYIDANGLDTFTSTLSKDEMLAFEFVSRIGDKNTSIVQNGARAYVEKLSKAARGEYMTTENFNKGLDFFKELGKVQTKDGGLNVGIQDMVDQLAEVITNSDVVVGYNSINFDKARFVHLLETTPEALKRLQDQIRKVNPNFDFNRPVAEYFDDNKHFDILRARNMAPGKYKNEFLESVFNGNTVASDEFANNANSRIGQLGILAKGMGYISESSNHASLIDTAQTLRVAKDPRFEKMIGYTEGYNRPMNLDPKTIGSYENAILYAKQSGSMPILSKNDNVLAMVQNVHDGIPYGDTIYSNGFKRVTGESELIPYDEYSPGAFSQGKYYKVQGMQEYSSEITEKTVLGKKLGLLGHDVVRVDLGLYNENPENTSSRLDKVTSLFIPKDRVQEELGALFGNVGNFDADGNFQLSKFGNKHINGLYKQNSERRTKISNNPNLILDTMQEVNAQYLEDAPERGLTRYSMATNNKIPMMRDILDLGNMDEGANKKDILNKAIKKAFNGDNSELVKILDSKELLQAVSADRLYGFNNPTGQSLANNLLKSFTVDGYKNIPWVSNVIDIASISYKDNILEQAHRQVMDEIAKSGIRSGKSIVYEDAMTAVIKTFQEVMGENYSELLESQDKWTNETGNYSYHLGKVNQLYKVDGMDKATTDRLLNKYIDIDLNNYDITLDRILRNAGIKKDTELRNNSQVIEDTVHHFIQTMSTDKSMPIVARRKLGAIARNAAALSPQQMVYQMSKTLSDTKDLAETFLDHKSIINNFIDTRAALGAKSDEFREFKNLLAPESKKVIQEWQKNFGNTHVQRFGNKPTTVFSLLNSILTGAYTFDKEDWDRIQNGVKLYNPETDTIGEDLSKIISQKVKTGVANISAKKKRPTFATEISNYIKNGVDIEKFASELSGYTDEQREFLIKEYYRNNMQLAETFGKSMSNYLQQSGATVSIDKKANKVFVAFGQDRFEIQQFIPKLRTNGVGHMSFDIGGSLTNARLGVEHVGKGQLKFVSFVEQSVSNAFFFNKQRLLDAEESGINPAEQFLSVLKKINSQMRTGGFTGSINSDDAFGYKYDTLLDPDILEKRLGEVRHNYENIPEATKYMKNLEKYIARKRDDSETKMYGSEMDAFLGLWRNYGLFDTQYIAPGTKDVGTNIMLAMERPMATAGLTDPLRDIGSQSENTIYYDTKEFNRITKETGLTDVAPGRSYGNEYDKHKMQRDPIGTHLEHDSAIIKIANVNENRKNEIYKALVANKNNGETIAKVFALRMTPTQGGGVMDSRLFDAYEASRGAQVVRFNKEDKILSNPDMHLRFDNDGNFVGYGRGVSVEGEEDAIQQFHVRYGDADQRKMARTRGVARLQYVTKDTNVIVSEEDLAKSVEQRLGRKANSREEFIDTADRLFKLATVSESLTSSANMKVVLSNNEKIITTSLANHIGEYDDDILKEIFGSDEAKKAMDILDFDFVHGTTLKKRFYDDLATMSFSSGMWLSDGKTQENSGDIMRQGINRVFNAHGITDPDQIKKEFNNRMQNARHATSKVLNELTGAHFYSNTNSVAMKHGSFINLVTNSIRDCQRQIAENNGKNLKAMGLAEKELRKAVELFNSFNVLHDQVGNFVKITTDGKIINLPKGQFTFNIDNLESFMQNSAYQKAAAKAGVSIQDFGAQQFNKLLGEDIQDMQGDLRVIFDANQSNKNFKFTGRELNGMSKTLLDDEIIQTVRQGMSEEDFNREFGYLVENGHLKKEYEGVSVLNKTQRAFMHDFGLADFGEARGGLHASMTSSEAFNEAKTRKKYNFDPYRGRATKDLLERAEGSNMRTAFASQKKADDLYYLHSANMANQFNNDEIDEKALIEDSGKVNNKLAKDWEIRKEALARSGASPEVIQREKEAFKKRYGLFQTMSIKDKMVFPTASNASAIEGDTRSPFVRNTIIDLADEEIGIKDAVSSRNGYKVAIPVSDITRIGGGESVISKAYQSKLKQVKNIHDKMKRDIDSGKLIMGSQEHDVRIAHYEKSVKQLKQLVGKYVKDKDGILQELTSTYAPSTMFGKVHVMRFNKGYEDMDAMLEGKKFNGKNLSEFVNNKTPANIVFVNTKDAAKMGFNKEYFKKLGLNEEQQAEWWKKAKTEGMDAWVHRWPSDYHGSLTSAKYYFDDRVNEGTLYADSITAEILKADSDGDWAQLMSKGIVNKEGQFIDLGAMGIMKKDKTSRIKLSNEDWQRFEDIKDEHVRAMSLQMYVENKYMKEYHDIYDKVDDMNIENFSDEEKAYRKIVDTKEVNIGLDGDMRRYSAKSYSKVQQEETQKAFFQHKEAITKAMQNSGINEETIARFNSATDGIGMATVLQDEIIPKKSLRQKLYQQLGDSGKEINKAFTDIRNANQANLAFQEKIGKQLVPSIDSPFVVSDYFRRKGVHVNEANSAAGLSERVLSREQNDAFFLTKEAFKEELLTAKHGNSESIVGSERAESFMKDLGEYFKDGGKRAKDSDFRNKLIDDIANLNKIGKKRYDFGSISKKFITDNKADMRKVGEAYLDGLDSIINFMRKNDKNADEALQNIYNLLNSANNKTGRLFESDDDIDSFQTMVERAMDYTGRRDTSEEAAKLGRRIGVNHGASSAFTNFAERVVNTKGSSLAMGVLGVAGALMLAGYAGGNPATPTENQAQQNAEQQQQQQPPRTLNFADNNVTPQNRVQPGYVININAKTQKDKDYASTVIAQAVTKNFKNTNVNVALNVNQQRSNINAKDLESYLSQAF